MPMLGVHKYIKKERQKQAPFYIGAMCLHRKIEKVPKSTGVSLNIDKIC